PPAAAAAARRTAREPRSRRRRTGGAADRSVERLHARAHKSRPTGRAGRGRSRAGAEGRPAGVHRSARPDRSDEAEGAVRVKAALTVLRKDLLLELRTFETIPAMVLFSLTTFVIFHFALNRATVSGQLAAGILTATLLFAAMLGINR